jgi:hypothetical protein
VVELQKQQVELEELPGYEKFGTITKQDLTEDAGEEGGAG